jgi:hypothetical protein
MARLLAHRTRARVVAGGVVAFLALFGLGLAIAPRGSGEAAGGAPEATVPATTIQPVQPAAPVSVGTVQALGKLPVLRAPEPRTSRRPSPRPRLPDAVVPPRAPPPVAPPPRVTPPPPVGPDCVGAGCDYK